MADISRVSVAEMDRIAGEFEQQIGEWDQAKTAIYQAKNDLDGMWDGVANDRFNEQWDIAEPMYAELYQVMKEYCDAIRKASEDYKKTEQDIHDNLNTF